MPTEDNSSKKESLQAAARQEIMARLDELGGRNVNDDALLWEGSQFVLPEYMKEDIGAAVQFLEEWNEQQNTYTRFSKTFRYRPYDGAAAFDRAMKRVFGTSGIGASSFFSMPELKSVPSGPGGQEMQVPWGMVELSMLDAMFALGATVRAGDGEVFTIAVHAPRKHRKRIEGFFQVIDDELRLRSIYKGHAITSGAEPDFLDTAAFDPSRVVYKKEVYTQLSVNLWSPIRHSEALRKAGIPLKRAVLLEGPNGTGKTLAGAWTAKIAEENGWTFILVRAGEDPLSALGTARMYAPSVVWIEDLEQLAMAGSSNITTLLDALDNAQDKGVEVMAGFTTNFAETLVRDVIRPGRLDAVIRIAELDADGYERLIKVLIPENLLDKRINYAQVTPAYGDMLPSFAAEAIQRAVRYSIARNDGVPSVITATDLQAAASGMQDHLSLMANALGRDSELPSLDKLLAASSETAARTALSGMLAQERIVAVDTYGDKIFTLKDGTA